MTSLKIGVNREDEAGIEMTSFCPSWNPQPSPLLPLALIVLSFGTQTFTAVILFLTALFSLVLARNTREESSVQARDI